MSELPICCPYFLQFSPFFISLFKLIALLPPISTRSFLSHPQSNQQPITSPLPSLSVLWSLFFFPTHFMYPSCLWWGPMNRNKTLAPFHMHYYLYFIHLSMALSLLKTPLQYIFDKSTNVFKCVLRQESYSSRLDLPSTDKDNSSATCRQLMFLLFH